MTRKLLKSILAVAAVGSIAAPAAQAAGPVTITGFTLNPSCVAPGGNTTATVGVQNMTVLPESFYAQTWATEGGAEVYRSSAQGPYTVPGLAPLSQSQSMNISKTTPWGYYTVYVGIGPSSSDPTSWSQASTTLVVSPFC
jgi:hypothetical protein